MPLRLTLAILCIHGILTSRGMAMEVTKTATLRPHSELFRDEDGELIEVRWLIVRMSDWNKDVLSDDVNFRVRPLGQGRILALHASS